MSDALTYAQNISSSAEIHGHLRHCDAHFLPRLSDRVDLAQYADKLGLYSDRFEAWADSELVGLVAVYVNDKEKQLAHISNVSVAPRWQRRQIAKNLMLSALEHTQSLHFPVIRLTVDERSEGAVALYVRLGFKVFESTGSLLSMQKALTRK